MTVTTYQCRVCGDRHKKAADAWQSLYNCPRYTYHAEDGWPVQLNMFADERQQIGDFEYAWQQEAQRISRRGIEYVEIDGICSLCKSKMIGRTSGNCQQCDTLARLDLAS